MRLRDQTVAKIDPQTLAAAEEHFRKKQTLRQTLQSEFLALRPELPTADPVKVQNLTAAFVDQLAKGVEFEVAESGEIRIFQGNERLTNLHGHPLKVADFVRENAEKYYSLDSPNAPALPAGSPVRFSGASDYMKQWGAAKSLAEKTRLVKAWQAQNA